MRLVVGMGASAGGLEALQQFFRHLPPDGRLAIVVVQHLEPGGRSLAPELLAQHSSLPVAEIAGGEVVEGGRIYVAPPGAVVIVKGGALLVTRSAAHEPALPVDQFLHSLAEDCGSSAVGVLLSGAGTDGTLGLKAVADAGGMTMAQDPITARYESMPRNAIATGVVDHVLAPERMPEELAAYVEHLSRLEDGDAARDEAIAAAIPQIAELLATRVDHDFKHYKTSTLARRIARRMQVLKDESVGRYLERLAAEPDEAASLFRELIIGVTAFFRDPDAFAALAEKVIPRLFEKRGSDEPVRVWVAGCATGQEAYSIAILLREQMRKTHSPSEVQVFATDIDERALSIARHGAYSLGIAEEVPPEFLERYFVKKSNRYHIAGEIRELCLFSPHNLITDPPFSRQDLISCRNLLIYLGEHLQKKLIPLFHYALRPGGFLFLGPSETIAAHKELFVAVDAKHRISQRRPAPVKSAAILEARGARVRAPASGGAALPEADVFQIAQRIILDEFAPRYVVVNDEGHLVAVSGGTSKYLEPPEGNFQSNIVNMVRTGLRVGLRAALREAVKTRRRVTNEKLSVRVGATVQRVRLTVQPMPELGQGEGLTMIVFEDLGPALERQSDSVPTDEQAAALIDQLERELTSTREDLEKTVQDLEASNEELKASNEELLSMNEELHSANEELETSREEIRATSDAVARANSDLENLLGSTRIATVFLDDDHTIRRYTVPAGEIYNLIPNDVGRPIEHITHRVRGMPPLPEASPLGEGPVENELLTVDERWYLRRVLPYVTTEGGREGVVVTFTEITERKRAQNRRAAEHAVARILVDAASFADAAPAILDALRTNLGIEVADLWVSDPETGRLRCESVRADDNTEALRPFVEASLARTFGRGEGLPGRMWDQRRAVFVSDISSDLNFPRAAPAAHAGLHSAASFPVFVGDEFFGAICVYTSRTLKRDDDLLAMMSAVGGDVGQFIQRTRAREALHWEEARKAAILHSALDCIITMDAEGHIVDFNPAAERTFGFSADEVVGRPLAEVIIPPAQREAHSQGLLRYLRTGVGAILDQRLELAAIRADGSEFPAEVTVTATRVAGERPFFTGYLRDITERKRAEAALSKSQRELKDFVDNANIGLHWVAADGLVLWVNRAELEMLGYTAEEYVGHHISEFHVDQPVIDDILERLCRGEELNDYVARLKCKDGSIKYGSISSNVYWEDGQFIHTRCFTRDITAERLADEARRTTEQRFISFMQNLPGAAWIKDIQGRYVFANEYAQRIFRTPLEQLEGRTDAEIFPPDTARQFQENDREGREIPGGVQTIEQLQHEDGVHHSLVSKFPIFDASGEPAWVGGIAIDITERRRAEQALRDSEAKLQAVLENTAACVFAKDLEGRYIVANRSFLELFGWPSLQDVLGKTDYDLHATDVADAYVANDRLVLQAGRPLEFDEVAHTDAGRRDYLMLKFPLRDAESVVYGVCGIATDITERKRNEEILRMRALQQRAVAELGQFALATDDLQQVFDRAVCEVARVLDNEYCKVLELLPEGNEVLLRAGVGWREGLVGRATVSTGLDSQAGYTLAQKEPVVVEDLRSETRFSGPPLLFEHGVVSGMSCIITGAEGMPWGVLGTHTTRRLRFTDDDVHCLQAVAHVLSSAIQRRAVEAALRESDERLRFTLDAARVGSWDWNIETGHVTWSENLEAIHGHPPGTFGGTADHVIEEVYPPDRPLVQQAIRKALEIREPYEVEYRYLRPDGSLGWLHGQGRATYNEAGTPVRMAGICMDVTERVRAVEITRLLAEAGSILASSLDHEITLKAIAGLLVPSLADWCAVDLVDDNGRPQHVAIVHSDPEKVGLTAELRRRYPFQIDAPHGVPNVIRSGRSEFYPEISDELLRAAAQDEEHFRILKELGLRSGLIVPLLARGRTLGAMTLVAAESGRGYSERDVAVVEELAARCALAVDNARLFAAAQRELTERRQTEAKLHEARRLAEATSRSKSEFLANMSHEIRTPMTAILGYADVLLATLSDPDDRESVVTIKRNGRYLLDLINDILDLSKIEAGRLEIERQRVSPVQVVLDVLSLMDVRAREKQLPFVVEFDGPVPETIQTDPTRLRQILVNLVGNAIKFTDAGSVQLIVAFRDGSPQPRLRFDIVDTGIGVSREQIERIFEPFTQADNSVTRRFGGTGLGLAISRRLAEMLDGSISVESEPGRGSRFSLDIATGPIEGVPLVEFDESALSRGDEGEELGPRRRLECRVLVVDDRRDIRYLAQHFIEEAGGRVEGAENGREALQRALAAARSGDAFDAIVLDMQMPEMDGYEAAARLRAAGIETPIIALTAAAMQGDRERCLEAGCDDYTSKPIQGERLVELLARYTEDIPLEELRERRKTRLVVPPLTKGGPGGVASANTSGNGNKPGLRILLVEDGEDARRVMSLLLKASGYEVEAVATEQSAVEAALRFRPDVVLADIRLAEGDGLALVRRLRSSEDLRGAVCIALSGLSDEDDRRRSLEAGFDYHVVKPVELSDLETLFSLARPAVQDGTSGGN